MMIERLSLEERVARHAALADPARLRIIDLLAAGDCSPVWLRAELGLSSSLLAHHLGVLEQAGLIARRRSEGDRRRSYVHLLSGALDGIGPSAAACRVVFVCTANSARSQLAAALWRQRSAVPAASAGTHPADSVAPGAVAAARRHGLPELDGVPRSIAEVLAADDLVVTVCDSAFEELSADGTTHARPGIHWSVPDPVRLGTPADFDAAVNDLAERVGELSARVATAEG